MSERGDFIDGASHAFSRGLSRRGQDSAVATDSSRMRVVGWSCFVGEKFANAIHRDWTMMLSNGIEIIVV